MNSIGYLIPLLLLLLWALFFSGFGSSQKTSVVKIGAVFTYNSVIGRAAKAAMEKAVSDVNADPTILRGSELRLIMQDSNCSVFMGSIESKESLDLSLFVSETLFLSS